MITMNKERKNKMKKMIADFLINEVGNLRLDAIKNTDRKAFYNVAFKMRETTQESTRDQHFYREKQKQMRDEFLENLTKNTDTSIPIDIVKVEPTDYYKDTHNARKAAIINNAHNRVMTPTEREYKISSMSRDNNQINIPTKSLVIGSKILGIYDITKEVSDWIERIDDVIDKGVDRYAFSSTLGLLSFICTEYAKLANDAYNTEIREDWALDKIGLMNLSLCKKWNGVIPMEDTKQNEKVEPDVVKADDLLPDGKAWKTEKINNVLRKSFGAKPLRLFISQPFTGKTEEEILKKREEVVAKVEKLYIGESIEVIDQYHQKCDVDRRLHHLAESIKLMDSADLIYFTSDWKSAPGCRIEYAIATEYGFNIMMDEPKRID